MSHATFCMRLKPYAKNYAKIEEPRRGQFTALWFKSVALETLRIQHAFIPLLEH